MKSTTWRLTTHCCDQQTYPAHKLIQRVSNIDTFYAVLIIKVKRHSVHQTIDRKLCSMKTRGGYSIIRPWNWGISHEFSLQNKQIKCKSWYLNAFVFNGFVLRAIDALDRWGGNAFEFYPPPTKHTTKMSSLVEEFTHWKQKTIERKERPPTCY